MHVRTDADSLTHTHAHNIPAGGLERQLNCIWRCPCFRCISLLTSAHYESNISLKWRTHVNTWVKGQKFPFDFLSVQSSACDCCCQTAVCLLAWVGANVYSTSACSQRLAFTYSALECVRMGMRVGGLPRRFTSMWVACFVGMLL